MITSRGSPRTSIVERVCRLLADGSEHRGRLQLVSPKYVLDVALATPTDFRTPLQRWAIEELHRGASLGMKVVLDMMLEMVCRSTRCQQVGLVMELPEPVNIQQAEVMARWLLEADELSKEEVMDIDAVFCPPTESSPIEEGAPVPNPLKDLWPALQRFSIDSCATSLYVDRGSGAEVSTWDVDRLKGMMVAIRERIRRAEENPEDEDLQVPVEVSERVMKVMESGGWEEVPSEGPTGMEDSPDILEALTGEYLLDGAKGDVFTCLDLHRKGEWIGEGHGGEAEEEHTNLRGIINRLVTQSERLLADIQGPQQTTDFSLEEATLINGDGHDEWDLAEQIRYLTTVRTGGPLEMPLPLDGGGGGEPKDILRMG
ncbi:hypothetical protein Pmar_PMAR012797 [Perkinsus marinus ATCC 50983]|uniref:Uncharacterized protein n=1 Tax=Perkinsus marinus (strain ATCC 50983 / TXsc) TaxID=423536 RepID=C5LQC3_PERM5|nr:hypothetical protein Pmar_PMAR012797 [Perkinsus marinus ATCC 50983]EER01070.1 hypothetical protein Pmar_PMAR012797 [Perkinsus marinus ATCC 50983]|eukprot:XP_002768352.1 hypothetical protein Pmar_PMAR012797 [Perkinsus marinus ATCC 50983]